MRDRCGARRRRPTASAAAAIALLAGLAAFAAPTASARAKPPKPVPAWYMTARNLTDLERQARHSACAFAKRQPKSPRLLLFDFGAAQKYRDGTFGASLRGIHRFRNGGILKALEAAARAYHRCHRKGWVAIAYGNTNSVPGYMSGADAREAGLHQALTVKRLQQFQGKARHYRHQSAAAAGDIEPGWGYPGVSKALVGGANGETPYYDFGNAGGCPGQPGSHHCYNGWDLGDLGEVSTGGRSRPLPEVYRRYEATQWARVQRKWPGAYRFAGVTGAPIEPLSPSKGWAALKRRADHVGRELVTIRDAGLRSALAGGSNAAPQEPAGGPMTGTIPAHLVPTPEPFFSTSLIHPVRNGWVAANHRRFLAVEAGADPVHPSTGVLGIFRQNYLRVSQTERVVKVPGAGPLRLTGGLGARARSPQRSPNTVRFTSARGVSGTLDLDTGSVAVDGSLTYEGCIANAGIDDCSEPLHNSLGNNLGLAVSPDGGTVYVAAYEGMLTALRRGGGGALADEGCFADARAHGCRDVPHDSLEAATGVAVSPDGRSVYVTSAQRTNAVTRFKRKPGGALVYRGCSANGGAHAGLAGCRQVARNSLDSNEAAAVSPDGRSLYVASSDSDSITRFKRKSNGALKYRGCIANRGAHRCRRPKHDSLGGAFDVAVSPDGRSVYVVSMDGNAITWFDRHPDGSLSYENCFANARAHGCRALGRDSLGGADSVAVSPDGKSVYVASLGGDSITRFERSPSGRLTPGRCYANGGGHGCQEPRVNSLHAADGVAVSPDGQSVYVTSMTGSTVNGGAGAVTHFERRPDGSLSYRGCFADEGRYGCNAPALDSLDSPQSIAVDPDGASVFVGSYGRQVSIFRRAAGGP